MNTIHKISRALNNLIQWGVRAPINLTMHPERFRVVWADAEKERDRLRRQGKALPCSLTVTQAGTRIIQAQFWSIMEG